MLETYAACDGYLWRVVRWSAVVMLEPLRIVRVCSPILAERVRMRRRAVALTGDGYINLEHSLPVQISS
jgi:hypothetical protein